MLQYVWVNLIKASEERLSFNIIRTTFYFGKNFICVVYNNIRTITKYRSKYFCG